jgi:hypothetical protein
MDFKNLGTNTIVSYPDINMQEAVPRKPAPRQPQSLLCFVVLCLSMFLNFALAFLHARGLPVSNAIVTVIQLIVTMLALPAFFSRRAKLPEHARFALAFIILSAIATNILNPFDPKTLYDSLLIPIYTVLGMSAASTKPKWMHFLLIFVLASTLLELNAPGLYTSLFDPLGYLSATRGWLEEVADKAASGGDSLDWVNRAGGSKLGFSDHRISGAFLEPLSLGYFGTLMAMYYAGLYRGAVWVRFVGIFVCLCFTLMADARVPTILIFVTSLFLLSRIKVPSFLLWMIFPTVVGVTYLIYVLQIGLYSDSALRLSLTFAVIQKTSVLEILTGAVSLARANDSGIVYMLRCLGPLGMITAIWFYSGAFTRQRGTNVSFFIAIATYLSVTLMFGGATLSIKTASLLGFLVGLASISRKAPSGTG